MRGGYVAMFLMALFIINVLFVASLASSWPQTETAFPMRRARDQSWPPPSPFTRSRPQIFFLWGKNITTHNAIFDIINVVALSENESAALSALRSCERCRNICVDVS